MLFLIFSIACNFKYFTVYFKRILPFSNSIFSSTSKFILLTYFSTKEFFYFAIAYELFLDLGANVRATPLQLEQFAVMGAIVARDVHDIPRPRVGLLNIGSEESKGHDLVQDAHARLRARAASGTGNIFEYRGFVEGQDIFGGEVDVVVTDEETAAGVLALAERKR